jgi:serine phosphatase RsbU (regulator of sigma subunit)
MKTNSNTIWARWCIWALLSLVTVSLYAQQAAPSPGLVKAALVYKYAQNMEWDNESTKSRYVFAVLSNDADVIKNFKSFNGKPIKSKPMSVLIFKSVEEITKSDVIYVDAEFAASIKDVLSKTKGNSTLLVSFNATDKKSVMINMNDEAGKIKFEVNKANILSEGMHVGPNLLLLGGSELDVAQLYKESQSNLEKEKETVKAQQRDLEQKEQEIQSKKAEIEKQRAEITKQHEEITKQKEEIEKQKAEIRLQTENLNKLKGDVSKQQAALAEKTRQLEEQVAKIKAQEVAIERQEAEMKEGRAKLEAQMHQIAETEHKIAKQKRVLLLQSAKIGLLENLNYVFAFILFLMVGLAFFIFRSYQIQKKGKKLMEEKNAQIALFASKLEIEQESTMNSIKYAKTIQNAILPQHSIMSKIVENFVIFRPKDIVAGDFFWFHHVEAVGAEPERIFIGALDCTGHGVPGAFMSMIGTSLLNEIVKEKKIYSPADILHNLNYGVMTALKQGQSDNNDGMDACLILIERRPNEQPKVIFSGAKRPLLYVLPETTEIIELKGDRKNIGGAIRKLRVVDFTNQEVTLPVGTMIYMTTDGFADQNDIHRAKFGMHRIHKVIHETVSMPVDTQKNAFETALDEHQGAAEQRDDITLIGVKL